MTVSPDEPSAALPGDLAAPPTEQRNPRTRGIDVLPTLDVLRLLNAEDATVPGAVERVLGALALVVDEAADRMQRGGRVHYFGAGSSGRIAMLDATELVPTFGLEWGMVVAHLAGGEDAMVRAVEGAEDDAALGGAEAGSVGALDTVIGLSASGRTPYVRARCPRRARVARSPRSSPATPVRPCCRWLRSPSSRRQGPRPSRARPA